MSLTSRLNGCNGTILPQEPGSKSEKHHNLISA
jgi:hypothetical protein